MDRKPLEGIESLTMTLSAILVYVLVVSEVTWWVTAIVVLTFIVVVQKVIDYLRKKNSDLGL